jgi:hypothetical protein
VKYPDWLPPEERESYDAMYAASSAGAFERLDREWVNLKQAIYDALPLFIRRFFVRPEAK